MSECTSIKHKHCPKCNGTYTWIVHNYFCGDEWFSRCGSCKYESIPTRNYDDAWKWVPENKGWQK